MNTKMTINSNTLTFIDTTDTKKIDVHISSNHPTVQLYDTNLGTYTPNWDPTVIVNDISGEPLVLSATVFADSINVTDLQATSYQWFKDKDFENSIHNTKELIIPTNVLDDANIVEYTCKATYNGKTYDNKIVFTLITTGKNGVDGQPGKDGSNGKDGTSVTIEGVAYAKTTPINGAAIDIYSDMATTQPIQGTSTGESYLVDGYLCVYNANTKQFICTGKIQGPQGQNGESTYLFTRYADDQNGNGFSDSPVGKKYIGFYRHSEKILPSTVGTGYSDWAWVKYVGEDAKSISLSATTQVFRVGKDGTVSPSILTITPQAVNTSIKEWYYGRNGGTFSTTPPAGVVRGNDGKITITGASMTDNSISVRVGDGTYSDTLTIYKVYDGDKGEDASIAFLTNENITFAADENGQVAGITVNCDVVAYTGTTPVAPTVGEIFSLDLPEGMSLGERTTTSGQAVRIPIIIAENSTLGSAQNANGEIIIPVITPIRTDLHLTWSKVNSGAKGESGVGISSVTVTYGVSTSASTQPTSWQSSIPTVTDGSYLWTRTITDYTDDTIADTVTYTYAKQGSKGDTGSTGSSVTVSKIEYQSGASATIAPTGTWSNSVVAVAEGNYLWTKTTFSDNKVAYGVAKQGVKGDKGDQGIQGPKGNDAYTVILTNESHIFAGDISNAIAGTATTQVLAYNGSTAQSVTIVSVNGKTATTTDIDTGIAGLKFKCSALSGTTPTITFTCTTSFVSPSGSMPIVLSVGGVQFTKMFTYSIAFKGTTGSPGSPGSPGAPASLVDITPSAHYFKSTTGKDGTFTPDYIYLYPRFQTVTYSKWEYSINGGTSWTTVTSGSNGLTIGTYNSVAYSLQIAKTSALYTDTITSISFRCVSSNAAVYDTVSIAKIYDVVDLQIGGRNYILNSAQEITKEVGIAQAEYLSLPYDLTPYIEEHGVDQTYTLSFDLKSKDITNNNRISVYPEPGTTPPHKYVFPSTSFVVTQEYQRFSITFKPTRSSNTNATMTKISVYGTYNTGNIPVIKNLKLELGNKATDWSPAPEDLKSTTFQLYAPKGYLLTNDIPEITLETFAYDGSQQITNATFTWSSWNGESWVAISGATRTSLTLNRSNVFKSGIYKCDMTYNGKVYTATATVEDKTDIYDSLIHVTSRYSPTNRLYWVLYSTVYSDEGEKDKLLGPVSVATPTNPTTGAYWYKIDESNYTVTLMKYSGTAWVATTDKQEFVYDWFMLNDTNNIVTLGERSKVKIVTSDNFSRTCSVQCNVLDQELAALTHSNQVLNDPSDPIVSTTEPINPINGQLWIKTGTNGSYTLLVWDASNSKWVVAEADTQKKVYVSKPTSYNDGDIWIVAAEYEPDAYKDGVLQTEVVDGVTKVVKHLAGTMLRAQYGSDTYKDSDWVSALTYKNEIDELKNNLNTYNQFFSFDNTGMTMKAKSLNGQISEFSTKLTNNELGFYQGENKVAYINNNQLNISKAEITNGMTIGGTEPTLQIGNFTIIQESNGSLSIGLKS